MTKLRTLLLAGFVCAFALGRAALAAPPAAVKPDFDREVRPILAETCFACHGFDPNRRQAGLRLDTAAGAYARLASGRSAVMPGKPEASELIRRVTADGPLHMPPTGSGKKLTPAQVAVLRRWIASGARYAPHWAFVAPVRPAIPAVTNARWPRNPIDRFLLARLEREQLSPSPEADRATLIRRVSFDLTGLPPTLAEIDAFLADKRPHAYERLVDRLLASPHYGERMALAWLDLARYADTHGFHIDSQRDMWRWREWVIDAFNRNMPYDQFVFLQLAGDLLPHATLEQKLATGFNRNHPINFEGGAIPEEYQTAYIVDRIDTTATAFMGLTMRCAQCHDHKYDPIRQQDYYRFYAYFNSIAEQGLDGQKGNAAPYIKAPTPEQERQLAETTAQRKERDAALQQQALIPCSSGSQDAEYQRLAAESAEWSHKQADLDAAIPTSMVMQELDKPRDTFVLIRGQYDQHGAKVTPGTPEFLPPLPPNAPPNRLALARWLIDPSHPLTARVAVNRYWQMLFGTGIVKTAEDFGTQGERPSHPELLDWLATEFIRTDWDIKAMIRLMVTSAAYRQTSTLTPAQRERDPENRLLARGPRVRLQAEFIRDQALALSGLLVAKIGGPSVKPYQPAGLWEELAFGGGFSAQSYQQDHGEALYRRSMYTFWKRTCPPPALQTLDAPEREFCMVRRSVTNTPLQALILMNDPTYVEAARKFAERIMTSGRLTPQARIAYAFRIATARPPRKAELEVLLDTYREQLSAFRKDPRAAAKLLAVGESQRDATLDAPELAAWSVIASTLLNLDETITKS